MKRIILLLVAVALPVFLAAQNPAIDKLFKKYSGKEGVTTVSISPDLFQMVNEMGIKDLEDADIPFGKIANVKILSIEDEDAWEGVNFYTEIKDELDLKDFAEVMTVNDGGEMVRIWMKVQKSELSEFLLIVGGDDNTLIYITGSFNMNDLEGLAKSMDHDLDIKL